MTDPEADPARRTRRYYELTDEFPRLWESPHGQLARLRTWDIFRRFLPPSGAVADIGGGPGTHAAHLAERGYDVTLLDPVPRHVEHARALGGGAVTCVIGDARRLPFPDGSFDAVVLMGPLYHLVDHEQRLAALREARRVLRAGGRLLAEVITRFAWIVDATAHGLLDDDEVQASFAVNLSSGLSNQLDRTADDVFWAYFHHPDEVLTEVLAAGFAAERLVSVEGYAAIVRNLEQLMEQPERLLATLRLVEAEPSLLGVSPHLMAVAHA